MPQTSVSSDETVALGYETTPTLGTLHIEYPNMNEIAAVRIVGFPGVIGIGKL